MNNVQTSVASRSRNRWRWMQNNSASRPISLHRRAINYPKERRLSAIMRDKRSRCGAGCVREMRMNVSGHLAMRPIVVA